MSEIEARLSRLETSNRLMKRAFFVLLALPGTALLMGQSAPDSPPPHRGTKAAVVLRLTADGNPQLQGRDVTGAIRFGVDSRTHGCTRVYLRGQAGYAAPS